MTVTDFAYLFGVWSFQIPLGLILYCKLVIAVIVFLLLENLYRNIVADGLWGVRFLIVALGALYIYDFILYADGLLFRSVGVAMIEARGGINLILVPFLFLAASRNPSWTLNVYFSRKVVFHTVTLVGSGAYLLGMAAAGYYIQNIGGDWGDILMISFSLLSLLILILLLSNLDIIIKNLIFLLVLL